MEKIIKSTWSEKYNKLSKNNDLVLDELLGTKYSLITFYPYL
tara:strand:+ start:212 stop:337 length:126 start_codon:yes stop_codon:yes gene_type:complete